jgi:uncharacterized SAM-dependent methyltransferase
MTAPWPTTCSTASPGRSSGCPRSTYTTRWAFAPREELRTEISAKFTRERLASDLAAAGLSLVDVLTDPEERFALSLSRRG